MSARRFKRTAIDTNRQFPAREAPACGTLSPAGVKRARGATMAAMSALVFQRVETLLSERGVPFDVVRHAPVFTSQEAADVRGTPLASGAKALVCKGDDAIVMFVVPADRKLDSKAIRQSRGWRKLRFVTREEVLEITGLEPGSIPPFGSLFGLPTFCDERLALNEKINFNAGDHSISVSMRYADYLRVESPELGRFAE
jgi:Ala-tRNA(Pro) deacylase